MRTVLFHVRIRLDSFACCQGQRGNTWRSLLFCTHVCNPRAASRIAREAVDRVPAAAKGTPEVIELCLPKVVAVGEWRSRNMLRARINRFQTERSAIVAVPRSLTLRTELPL